jgi:hypothetical protein
MSNAFNYLHNKLSTVQKDEKFNKAINLYQMPEDADADEIKAWIEANPAEAEEQLGKVLGEVASVLGGDSANLDPQEIMKLLMNIDNNDLKKISDMQVKEEAN